MPWTRAQTPEGMGRPAGSDRWAVPLFAKSEGGRDERRARVLVEHAVVPTAGARPRRRAPGGGGRAGGRPARVGGEAAAQRQDAERTAAQRPTGRRRGRDDELGALQQDQRQTPALRLRRKR